jgi:hypothetical protein
MESPMNERAYKCWFEFLKRSKRYKECCLRGGEGELAKLYADFGDVHAPDLLWSDWWVAHQDLFSGIEPLFVINEVSTKAEFDRLFEDDQDDLLAIIINLHAPKQTILDEVESVIKRLQLEKRVQENELILESNPNAKVSEVFGRPRFDPSYYHRYGLVPVPNSDQVGALERMLEVYDRCVSSGTTPSSSRAEWCEIADYLGVMVIPLAKTTADQVTLTPEEENIQKAQKAKRYFKQACELIENVELGIFPKHG